MNIKHDLADDGMHTHFVSNVITHMLPILDISDIDWG